MGLYSGWLIIGRIFASEIWGGGGLIFGRTCFSEGLIIRMLRYGMFPFHFHFLSLFRTAYCPVVIAAVFEVVSDKFSFMLTRLNSFQFQF